MEVDYLRILGHSSLLYFLASHTLVGSLQFSLVETQGLFSVSYASVMHECLNISMMAANIPTFKK